MTSRDLSSDPPLASDPNTVEARSPGTSAGRHLGRAAAVGATIGLVVGGVAVATAQLVAGIVNPAASPILTVGQSAIDAAPEWLKDRAIREFGSGDKSVLLAGIGVVLALAAIALGIASLRRLWVGVAGLVAFGAIGVIAALTRPVAKPADVLPVLAATAMGLLTLVALRSCVRSDASATATGAADAETSWAIDRRRFLLTATAGVVGAVAAGGAGNFFGRRFRADASRAAVGIPTPASRAASIGGAELHVPGLGPFLTPNERFYRVDTALFAPAVTAEDWSLRIHGMVRREITLDYER
ncbi:MAG TPA: molybdopterin-binding oxidoreductase, partial [Actinomycetota bacterium]|nr:molybdopterin-binding oxidoreductase [Actinomycetota bacterium]